ncbi:asparagine synthase-related protein [Halorubellus litoreus]|uniref:Asparagine synthase-related protein n=1 Tax=Halorubellus litoreus TaxID=755308 RepID=A0ABD5VCJ9_9EURY
MSAAVGESDASRRSARSSMNTELFGVFGDREEFERHRDPTAFDVVLETPGATVGVRARDLDVDRRTDTYSTDAGGCALFGEVVEPQGQDGPARAVYERADRDVDAALDALNGSYLAFVDVDDDPFVATDPLRSWECFYADVDGTRVFGTDVAALERLVDDRTPDETAVLELLHLGTVLGERTLFADVARVPPDATLTPTGTADLSRFVYEPSEFDHVGELTRRLEAAIERRSHYPGSKGVLLSGGHDSRLLLSQIDDVAASYTVGSEDSREVRVAKKLASQYDAPHTTLEPGARYLYPSDDKLLYAQGVKEALHIHHAGYEDAFDVDVMYHGLLFDTILKGYFLEWDDTTALGATVPSNSLVDDPSPVDCLLDTLGFEPDASARLGTAAGDLLANLDVDVDLHVDSSWEFLADRFREELDACRERADSLHNATDLLVLRNQPVMPFRVHLADNYLEPFVAMDADLLDWHLRTPPGKRNGDTCRRALERVDEDIFEHAAPSKPHSSPYLNVAEELVRRVTPFVEEFERAWPNRGEVYDENDLAERLFPDHPAVRDLPERQQLRVNGVRWWLG